MRPAISWRRRAGVPRGDQIAALLPLVGWDKVEWRDRVLTLPRGMEIDLGGIGKEYAVDRAAACIAERSDAAVLVNFGGDLVASGPRRGGANARRCSILPFVGLQCGRDFRR